MGLISWLKAPAPDWLRKIEKVTRVVSLTAATIAAAVVAKKFIPPSAIPKAIIPIAKKVVSKITVKRAIVGSVIAGAAVTSPTVREIIKKAPTAPFRTGKKLGEFVEREIAPIAKKEPKGKVRKALEIGGIAGLAAAGAIVVGKKIKEKRAAKAAVTVTGAVAPISVIPSIPSTPTIISEVVPSLAAPQAEIIAPTAVVEPVKRKRVAKRRISPLVINQIQISN